MGGAISTNMAADTWSPRAIAIVEGSPSRCQLIAACASLAELRPAQSPRQDGTFYPSDAAQVDVDGALAIDGQINGEAGCHMKFPARYGLLLFSVLVPGAACSHAATARTDVEQSAVAQHDPVVISAPPLLEVGRDTPIAIAADPSAREVTVLVPATGRTFDLTFHRSAGLWLGTIRLDSAGDSVLQVNSQAGTSTRSSSITVYAYASVGHITAKPSDSVEISLAVLPYGGDSGAVGRRIGNQAATIVPSSIGYDPQLDEAIISDPVNGRLVFVALSPGSAQSRTVALPSHSFDDVLVNPENSVVYAIDQSRGQLYRVEGSRVSVISSPDLRTVPLGLRVGLEANSDTVFWPDLATRSLRGVAKDGATSSLPPTNVARSSQPISIVEDGKITIASFGERSVLVVDGLPDILDVRDIVTDPYGQIWMLVGYLQDRTVHRALVLLDPNNGTARYTQVDVSVPGDMTRLLAPREAGSVLLLDGDDTSSRVRSINFSPALG
jgi:hypothetical protein